MAEEETGAWYLDEEHVQRVEAEEKQLRAQLAAIRNGALHSPGLSTVLSDLGKHHMLEARPDIEGFLTSQDRDERCAALIVLAVDFHIQEHWETARQFLEHDPDDRCRIAATTAFAALMAETHNRPTLQLLAQVVHNQDEKEPGSGVAGEISPVLARFSQKVHRAFAGDRGGGEFFPAPNGPP